MPTIHDTHSRRKFLKASAVITTGLSGFGLLPQVAWSSDEEINIIGPRQVIRRKSAPWYR